MMPAIALVARRIVVALCRRPASLRGIDVRTLEPATSLDDEPFAIVDLPNGECITVAVVRDCAGRLRLNAMPAARVYSTPFHI